jgi:hypothetical protein
MASRETAPSSGLGGGETDEGTILVVLQYKYFWTLNSTTVQRGKAMAGKYLPVMFGLGIRVFDETTSEIDISASGDSESLSLRVEEPFDQKWYNLNQGMQICAILLTCGPACVASTD